MLHDLILPLLFVLGLVTGFIGTNTGGSSLITVPIMVWLGISPQSAIANARVASVGTMAAGLTQFHKEGKVDYRLALKISFLGIIGALAGAYFMLKIPTNLVEKSIGILTLLLLCVSLLKKKTKLDLTAEPSKKMKILGYLLFIIAGFVGGFFGGQAIIATYIFSLCFNKSMLESVGTRKVSGLLIALAALFIYGFHGIINWSFGLALIVGTIIGSTFGAKYAIKKGDKWIENIFNVVIIILSLKMIF